MLNKSFSYSWKRQGLPYQVITLLASPADLSGTNYPPPPFFFLHGDLFCRLATPTRSLGWEQIENKNDLLAQNHVLIQGAASCSP